MRDLGKTLRGLRRELLSAQGVDPDKHDAERESESLPDEWEGGIESNMDDFLNLLDSIDPDDTRSDQGETRKMMREAKQSLGKAVLSYQDYINSMLETQSPEATPRHGRGDS